LVLSAYPPSGEQIELAAMIRARSILLAALAALTCWISAAAAAQLRVEPVLLELNAPAAAGTLNLRNDEDTEITVQTRVMKWTQTAGKETLEPTTDVVASPPAVALAPGADYVVRIVRVTKQPVRGEESYRVLVDQLPRLGKQQNRSVNLLIRQSIPVFFRAREFNSPAVAWSISPEAGKLVVAASNTGDERLRIASLRLKDSSGATISFGSGLVGYVLGRSSMSWIAPNYPRGFGTSGPVSITAETDKGPTHAVVQSPLRR
jgi:fimbrial chaperone protein